ncbi:MAG: class I SAM-dependent methyltransferase [Saprospiraceae bacterium]
MKKYIRKINAFIKGLILWFRPGVFLGFLSNPFLFLSNLFCLTKWISAQQKKNTFDDFFIATRDHARRYKLYEHVIQTESLADIPLTYLEFGVSEGYSFRWWTNANKHPSSTFYGFDTFEGLPESWGTYGKGDMSAGIPDTQDQRCTFIKGLFQDTLFDFIKTHSLNEGRKIIHLDADLFSSTLFVLATLAPCMKTGDILFFDEFNVPDHEWMAYRIFTESFYVKTEILGAVNNYYQVAFKIV